MLGFGLLVLLLVGGLVLALVLGGAGSLPQIGAFRPCDGRPRTAPREVPDARLTHGEIDQEEYAAIRARIEQ
jgi:hypothetical protein